MILCWVCGSVSGLLPRPRMSMQWQCSIIERNLNLKPFLSSSCPHVFALSLLCPLFFILLIPCSFLHCLLYGLHLSLCSLFPILPITYAVYLFMSQTINLSIAYIYRSTQDKQHNALHFIERQISWMTLTYVCRHIGGECRGNQWPC